MNISRAEQRTLHALAQGGGIVLERDVQGRTLAADCIARDGYRLADCTLSVWKKLKAKRMIQSIGSGPYRVNRDGLARMGSQLDNRVSQRRW